MKTVDEIISNRAREIMKARNVSILEAIQIVFREYPALADAYKNSHVREE